MTSKNSKLKRQKINCLHTYTFPTPNMKQVMLEDYPYLSQGKDPVFTYLPLPLQSALNKTKNKKGKEIIEKEYTSIAVVVANTLGGKFSSSEKTKKSYVLGIYESYQSGKLSLIPFKRVAASRLLAWVASKELGIKIEPGFLKCAPGTTSYVAID